MRLAESVAIVNIDDGKVNALNPALMTGLLEALQTAEDQARAVVIAGRPGVMSAGLDLRVLDSGEEASRDLFARTRGLMLRLATFPLPVVAACTGHALAGGALLLLCCDVRIGAVGEFKIGLTEVAVGIPMPELALELARRRLSTRHFVMACQTAQVYSPAEAVEVGFLDRLGDGDVIAEAIDVAGDLVERLKPAAFAATRVTTSAGLTTATM